MDIANYLPVWNKLTKEHQQQITNTISTRSIKKGTIIHNGCKSCVGVFLILSGQLRAYILSDEGREITLYRLFDRDVCILSAPCMMRSIQFDIIIETEKDSELLLIPVETYKRIMEESAPLANYTNEIMASRFSDAMWLIEEIMWKSLDKRVASFLLEESSIEGTNCLKITHEIIANHIGTHREVVTRMLRYFQNEGFIKLTRGTVEIIDSEQLRELY